MPYTSCSAWLGDHNPDIWIPSNNKITVDLERQYARELFRRPQARQQFLSYMGELMLQQAPGGYISHIDFVHQFDIRWHNQHPGSALCAARQSAFPPCEYQLWRWVRLYFPAWLQHFWPDGQFAPRHNIRPEPPWTDQGLHRPFSKPPPKTVCPGTTSRRWRSKPSLPRRRRIRRTQTYPPHASVRHRWLGMLHSATWLWCPLQGYLGVTCSIRLHVLHNSV